MWALIGLRIVQGRFLWGKMRLRTLFVILLLLDAAFADDWPHYLGPNYDLTWREGEILETVPEKGLPVVWTAKIGGGYGGPSVANGRRR